jgi:hypothetical protein
VLDRGDGIFPSNPVWPEVHPKRLARLKVVVRNWWTLTTVVISSCAIPASGGSLRFTFSEVVDVLHEPGTKIAQVGDLRRLRR